MVCERCGGYVEWIGPLANLTHTRCVDCGGLNCQVPEGIDACESVDRTGTGETEEQQNDFSG